MHSSSCTQSYASVLGVASSEGDVMSPHFFEMGLRVYANSYIEVLKDFVKQLISSKANEGIICSNRTSYPPIRPKNSGLVCEEYAIQLVT